MINLFTYTNYQEYLVDLLKEQKPKIKQTQLAQAAQCQPAYLTRVLQKQADLNVDQLLGISDFLGFSKSEVDFFIQLLLMNRSFTSRGREYFKKNLQDKIAKQLELNDKITNKKQVSDDVKNYYYSSWLVSVIHVAVSIPKLRTKDELKKHINISTQRLNEILDFLEKNNLIIHKDHQYKLKVGNIFLDKNDANIIRHHQNWRYRALQSLEVENDHDFHYSSVYTLSATDVLKIKRKLVELIPQILKVVEPSEEEKLYALTIDYFDVLNN